MKIQLSGRINQMVKNNDDYLTILDTPAPDAYSQPSSYKISSAQQLGQNGDEITIECELKGFVKRKPYTEKNTGIQKVFWEGNVYFNHLRTIPKSVPKTA